MIAWGICGDAEKEVEILIFNKLRDGSSSNFKKREGDFAGHPVIKTSLSSLGGASLIPCQGARILHASQPKKNQPTNKNQNINNRSNIVTNSIKTLKMVHIKQNKAKRERVILKTGTCWNLWETAALGLRLGKDTQKPVH